MTNTVVCALSDDRPATGWSERTAHEVLGIEAEIREVMAFC
jgi:hypothetical protein